MTSIQISAHYDHHSMNLARPAGVELEIRVATLEEAKAIEALFPKSARMYATTLTDYSTEVGQRSVVTGIVHGRIQLKSDGVNGGANETGIKRYRSIVRKALALGYEVEWSARCQNSYQAREDFEANI